MRYPSHTCYDDGLAADSRYAAPVLAHILSPHVHPTSTLIHNCTCNLACPPVTMMGVRRMRDTLPQSCPTDTTLGLSQMFISVPITIWLLTVTCVRLWVWEGTAYT